ncbi:MAG: type IV toxin-antitoxin system AbiEi family antitoxin domain-containing protein [Ornithinimicrobium sp.]
MEWLTLDHRRRTGLFTLEDTGALGLPRRDVDRMVRRGDLARVAPGAFVLKTRWASLTVERKHVLRAQATMLRLRAPTLLSHQAAAAVHGLPLLWAGTDITGRRVHLTRRGPGPTRSTAEHTVHESYGEGQRGQVVEDIPVVSALIAAFGVTEVEGFVAGVVALDAALHHRQTTSSEAWDELSRLRRRPHTATIRRVIGAAHGASESPLETQARLVLTALGHRMRPQVRLVTASGAFVARVDGLLDALGVVVEVDGRSKYRANDGSTSMEALLSEKRRESAIRDLGYAVLRIDHALIRDTRQLDEHVKAAASRSHPRRRLRT